MNNIWIIFEREYLERVRKRSFLIATILTPLIIPLIGALAVFLTSLDDGKEKTIYLIDEAGLFPEGLTISEYVIEQVVMSVDEAKENLNGQDTYGVLYIPELDIDNPKGIEFYSKSSPGLTFLSKFRRPIKERIETLKMKEMQLDAKVIARLKTSVDISTFNVSESGESKKSSAAIASGIGYFMAFLTYMFVFVYGSFIMQSVLNEKTSKIVEVIVSSVKPFQLMLGKVLANGAVALTQFGLWIFLISTFFFVLGTYFGIDPRAEQQQMIQEQMQAIQQLEQAGSEAPQFVVDIFEVIQSLPIAKIVLTFLYYFLGGFLLFGALFAAVGSAVDSLQEAQQFTFPISLPIVASILLMGLVLENPDGTASVILTLIPFTSPVLMMARIPFGVPEWQLLLSMLLLVGGFVFTLWIAGRIYRVGILSSGSKVNYKTLVKWFMMKNY